MVLLKNFLYIHEIVEDGKILEKTLAINVNNIVFLEKLEINYSDSDGDLYEEATKIRFDEKSLILPMEINFVLNMLTKSNLTQKGLKTL